MRQKYLPILLCSVIFLLMPTSTLAQAKAKLKAYSVVRPARDAHGNVLDPATASAISSLATFSYTVTSSRDSNTYTGAMVGQNPFGSGFSPTIVTTPVIPLIITTNAVATSVNKAGFITTKKGVTTFDPTVADSSCLTGTNDVPVTLFQQSPIFQSARFKFGHTSVGDTQYLDAFQRGNFWQWIAAHEVGEWMDDPFGNNPTPAWGHTGQVGGCQNNLEVGDPLTGTNVPTVQGANGFTYHLQELAFFSWFYGAPSIAVNGWFSDNNTFKTDAGPVCQ